MKKIKRIFCLLLAVVALLGMTVLESGVAPTFSDADQIVHVEAVNRAAELGYFVGSDGRFMPRQTVTRAQMATVMVKVLHGSDYNADPYKNKGRFPDTAEYQGGWADGYINLCAQEGVVGGYGDGTFGPNNKVTAAEAVTMLLNAFKVDAGKGNWPDTVMNKGAELGLFAELPGVVANTALDRDQLATLVMAGVDWQEKQSGGATDEIIHSEIIPDDKNLVIGLNNIPIATSDMTEDELRDIVVEFMKLQLTFAYTPEFKDTESYQYYIKNLKSYYGFEESQIGFEEGNYYGGVPYTGNAAGSIYRWIPFYDAETGVMDWTPIVNSARLNWKNNGTVYPDVGSALFGNSCSAACYWAWGRVSNELRSAWTSGWVPQKGFVKVGEYTLANNDTGHGDHTKNVCKENGTDVMYKAYASMKKADGLIRTGHAIMNVADPVVVYKADGSIDGNKSYLCIAEQQAFFLTDTPDNGGVELYSPLGDRGLTYRVMGNYWGSVVNGQVKDMEWSFKELYDQGFLPFTAPELVGKDPVEKATVTFSHKKDTITLDELEASSVFSNYSISDVHFTVRDAGGNENYIGMYAKEAGTLTAYKKSALREGLKNNVIYSSKDYIKTELGKYTGGSHELIITCRVSTGESLNVYTGTLQ